MGFLLFRAETSRAAALNLRRAATLSPAKAAAKEAAGVAIAGKNKVCINRNHGYYSIEI